jgi:hypothetical protein
MKVHDWCTVNTKINCIVSSANYRIANVTQTNKHNEVYRLILNRDAYISQFHGTMKAPFGKSNSEYTQLFWFTCQCQCLQSIFHQFYVCELENITRNKCIQRTNQSLQSNSMKLYTQDLTSEHVDLHVIIIYHRKQQSNETMSMLPPTDNTADVPSARWRHVIAFIRCNWCVHSLFLHTQIVNGWMIHRCICEYTSNVGVRSPQMMSDHLATSKIVDFKAELAITLIRLK